jgi:hypothetical protein
VLAASAAPAAAGPDPTDRSGDLRPEAAALLDAADLHPGMTLGDAHAMGLVDTAAIAARVVRTTDAARDGVIYFAPPTSIRVWRRGLDGSSASCSGRVDVIPFEDYVKGVLPHEWIASWDDEALKAGAVAIRTYAAYWVAAGGKYSCADLDDTTASQVYKDDRNARASAAVDATAGAYVVKGGDLVFAEYSAENGDPTADGVDEPLCAGKAVNGHGHGVCQWGSQRWAQSGKTFDWIVPHYYPGSSLIGLGPAYDASLSADSYATTMTSGDEVVVWLEYANDGSASWDPASVLVGTTEPRDRASAFFKDGNWVSPSRPTPVDHSGQAPGAVARFTWAMVAPDVTQPTTFTESFGLVTADGTWFGPADDAVTWTITVVPSGGGGSGSGGDPGGGAGSGSGNDPGGGSGGDGALVGGCSATGGGAGGGACAILVFCALALRRRL